MNKTKTEKFTLSSVVNEYNVHIVGNGVKSFFTNTLAAAIIIGIIFVIITPLISMLSKSFMTLQDRYNPLIYLIPSSVTVENYRNAFTCLDYPKVMLTTMTYTIAMMLIQTFICAFVGYGFARFKFPGNGFLFGLVILTIVIPVQTIMVPLYTQFRYFDVLGLFKLISGSYVNLLDTFWPMTLMSVTGVGLRSGLFIYIYRQFFKSFPKEFEEAAFIDGAGVFRTYFNIMLPNASPPIITVMMLSFVWQYNDIFFASMFSNSTNLLSVKLTTLASTFASMLRMFDPNEVDLNVNAGLVLAILPLIIIYIILQKYFMQGVERSGITG